LKDSFYYSERFFANDSDNIQNRIASACLCYGTAVVHCI